MTIIMVLILSGMLMVFSALLILGEYKRGAKERYIFKSLASLMFILIGLASLFDSRSVLSGAVFVFAGLVFSLFGDEFLAVYDDKKRKRFFLLGVAAFSCAHIFYSIYFIRFEESLLWSLLLAAIVTIASLGGIVTFKMKLGKCLVPVMIYSFLVSFAFSNAFFMVIQAFSLHTFIMALGMLLFLFSDVILLFKYFYAKAPRSLTALNLSSYYLAQLLLCFGITLFI